MKNPIVLMTFFLITTTATAWAQNGDKHALGDLYTKALNVVEFSGMLDRIEPKKHVPIKDIHADHGQVLITVESDTGPTTITYDLMTNKILY